MVRKFSPAVAIALAVAGLAACDDPVRPEPDGYAPVALDHVEATPAPLTMVAFGAHALELWPFTGTSFDGTPQDPVNLLFPGAGDARRIRAALMMLNGDRSAFGFPNQTPFNCTWKDAVGGNQTAFSTAAGWVGSAIQLECGEYDPIRFHLRLFPSGHWTIANAHFEVLIPGTTDHEVLAWELAEQLVTVDFLRSGLLDPAAPLGLTAQINPAPSYRTINPLVYNGLPAALKLLITGSTAPAAAPVPIATNGMATMLNVATQVDGEPVVAIRDFVLEFNQIVPKPVCASGPFDFLLVTGPVHFRQRVIVTPSGNYLSQFHAHGRLELTPVNPLTSPPTVVGESFSAVVEEQYRNIVTDEVTLVSSFAMRIMLPPQGPFRGRLQAQLRVGPGESSSYSLRIECLP